MHTQKDPNGEAIVRLGLDLLDASEKLHPVVNDLMAYKRLSKADAACRAIIRPPAGRLIKQYSRRNRAMSELLPIQPIAATHCAIFSAGV